MAADEQDDRPSLEPPRLLGRRRRSSTPAPAPEAAPVTAPDADTRVLPVDDATFTDTGADAPDDAPAVGPGDGPAPARTVRRRPRVLRASRPTFVVPRYAGAAAVGLVTGIALLTLVWLGFLGCETLTGGATCGTGPGLVALLVVFALAVLLGRTLLGLLKVPEAGMTSFLAVGVTGLVVMLSPEALFDSTAILVVLPLLCAGAFAGSSWVATLQLDPDA